MARAVTFAVDVLAGPVRNPRTRTVDPLECFLDGEYGDFSHGR